MSGHETLGEQIIVCEECGEATENAALVVILLRPSCDGDGSNWCRRCLPKKLIELAEGYAATGSLRAVRAKNLLGADN